MKPSDFLYLQPMPDGVLLLICHPGFCQSVLDSYRSGVTMKELAAHCGMSEAVLKCILRRELGFKRDERIGRIL